MVQKASSKAQIGGITLNSTSFDRLLKEIIGRIEKNKKTFIVTPNPEFIVYAQKNPWFKKILNQADFAIPDGIGLVWASRFLEVEGIQERISGTDLMEKLCQEAAKRGWKIYLLGGRPGVVATAAAKLKIKNKKLKIWAESGSELEIRNSKLIGNWKFETGNLVKKINSKHPDLLFVALGMGKQEKFIYDNWDKLNIKLAMGVGGAFDYISGQLPRAPKWVQKAGFEWLFRLVHQPWRLRRQQALLKFICLVFREKLLGA